MGWPREVDVPSIAPMGPVGNSGRLSDSRLSRRWLPPAEGTPVPRARTAQRGGEERCCPRPPHTPARSNLTPDVAWTA